MSNVQLNLLPDVKQQYIKAQDQRRLVLSISIIVAVASVFILVLLLGVDLAQKKHLNDLTRDINTESSQLKNKPNIDKILTVQNQLGSLTALHAGKPAASRLFDTYLNQVTPASVSITSFHIDFTLNTINLTGTADALSTVNKYVDTLKFTTYTSDSNKTTANAFSNVVLNSFGVNSGANQGNKSTSFNVNLVYDKSIFDITRNVTLAVPSITTTRSELDQPGDLFVTPVTSSTTGGGH